MRPVALRFGALAAMRTDATQSALDGLTAHVCVLDEHGTIVAVNQAWRAYALANGADSALVLEGSNYLHACLAQGEHLPADGPFIISPNHQQTVIVVVFEHRCEDRD